MNHEEMKQEIYDWIMNDEGLYNLYLNGTEWDMGVAIINAHAMIEKATGEYHNVSRELIEELTEQLLTERKEEME